MLDIVFAGVTGVVLAVVLSQPPKVVPPPAPEEPAPKQPPAGANRGKRVKSKWD